MRRLYGWLIRLHPRSFRERFGEEIRSIYDEAAVPRRLLVSDAAASLFRQWVLRPQPRRAAPAGGAMFCLLESETPRRAALVNGFLCSVVAFGCVAFAIARGGGAPLRDYTGIFALGGADFGPATPVQKVPAATKVLPAGALLIVSLDRDRDGVISAAEIAAAPAALRELEKPPGRPIEFVLVSRGARSSGARLLLLEVLDADGDGVLSEAEIANAAAALRRLDRNGDGNLTAEEIFGTL